MGRSAAARAKGESPEVVPPQAVPGGAKRRWVQASGSSLGDGQTNGRCGSSGREQSGG